MIHRTVAIVGGGFSGAVFALHLLREAKRSLSISVVEPKPSLGRGLAYGTRDPDHRLNGPIETHMVYPEQPSHLRTWFLESGGLKRDPEAASADGSLFIRRSVFGEYVGAQLEAAAMDNSSGSHLSHLRDRAVDVVKVDAGYRLVLENAPPLIARTVILAAGHEQPEIPRPFVGDVSNHEAFLASPWDSARIEAIPPDARVLVLGVAQTGSEVIAGLLRRGHRGPITALSRRGLRPAPRPVGAAPLDTSLYDRINRPESLFKAQHGEITSVVDILRQLRINVRAAQETGATWAEPFGILRDSLWQIWPALSIGEKRRFMRHLRRWYNAHRFQLSPQVEECLRGDEKIDRKVFRAGSVCTAEIRDTVIAVSFRARGSSDISTGEFDAIVNCTGIALDPTRSTNRFLTRLVDSGLAIPHGTGEGLAVDSQHRAINANGQPEPGLVVVGPLTYGSFADQQGAAFIAARIGKMMPAFVQSLTNQDVQRLRGPA